MPLRTPSRPASPWLASALALATLLSLAATARAALDVDLRIEVEKPTVEVSPHLYGLFFEDINYGADGGLYAKLVQNRSFEFHGRINPEHAPLYAWEKIERDGARVTDWSGPASVTITLELPDGTSAGSLTFDGADGAWRKFEGQITATHDADQARLVVTTAGRGTLALDMVSLFQQDTWRQRKYGLRNDLVQALADLHPRFLRFPGGCIAHGHGLANLHRWKDTVGDIAERKPNWNLWGYHQTSGLGYFEYFQLCEDLGAHALPVLPVGVSCGFRGLECVPMSDLQPHIQDVLDLVEFANGSADSRWGSVRARTRSRRPARHALRRTRRTELLRASRCGGADRARDRSLIVVRTSDPGDVRPGPARAHRLGGAVKESLDELLVHLLMSMKTKIAALLISAGLLLGSIASAEPKTFQNPIISGMNPDPTICRVGDDYYLVTSTFEYFPGLPVYHSKDLVHWKMIGYALDRESQNRLHKERASGGQYAPTIRYHDGTFYIIGTNYADRGVFYVTARNPAGPWSEPHWLNIKFVDPSLLFADGKVYYVSPDENGDFQLGVLNLETDTFEEPLKVIAKGQGGSSPEGPHLYKINGYYYLMTAEGGTGYEHREVIQRSKSPWGPYEPSPFNPLASHMNDPGNPFHAIGHADLVQLPDDSWWMVCLGIRPRNGRHHVLGRETFLAPVTWSEDGWPRISADGIVRPEYPAPNLPEHLWAKEPARDGFDGPKLGLAWNFVRNPYATDRSLTERPGFLRLRGSKISAREQDSPAYVCRRQTAFEFLVSTKIAFAPKAPNEEAGLLVRGDDANHYDFVITLRGGKRVALLRQFLQNREAGLNTVEIGDGDVILRISGTDRDYAFWVQEEGKTAVQVGTARTKDISTEMITGFTGTFVGMYASGNGQANTTPADFDWFDFEENPATPHAWSQGELPVKDGLERPSFAALVSPSHDAAKLEWHPVADATGYTLERQGVDRYDTIATLKAGETSYTDSGLKGATLYLYRVTATNSSRVSLPSIGSSVVTRPTPGPFTGKPSPIPGKIEAENYDHGERGVASYDIDEINTAEKYRTDGTDIEFCWDSGGGYNLCQIVDGEWVVYTVNVSKPVVDVELRIVSPADARIRLELDGTTIAEKDIKSTGGWHPWTTIVLPSVQMETGENKRLKVIAVKGGFNLNWLEFK